MLKIIQIVWHLIYRATLVVLFPLNYALALIKKDDVCKNSVLHISFMVHEPYCIVKILNRNGIKADYLAVGTSPIWDRSDYKYMPSKWPFMRALQEFLLLWRLVSRYEVVHCHFMYTPSLNGWELFFLKKMGRKIVVHYMGCEIRDREKNMRLHPSSNICEDCDYIKNLPCKTKVNLWRRKSAQKYGDLFLVTTPDMLEFAPNAIQFPFFILASEIDIKKADKRSDKSFKIVHCTAHPGIEGSKYIAETIRKLQKEGYLIDYVFLSFASYENVLNEYASADIAIGKMKMGHYANGQIESMFLGVPTITYIRPEFVTEVLANSGFILTDLNGLERTLRYYIDNPDKLQEKKKIARESICRLHNNDELAKRLIDYYKKIN